MFPFKFNCNNEIEDPLLKQLHASFNATPFLPPSSKVVELLYLVGHRGQQTFPLGPIESVLVKNGIPFNLKPNNGRSTNVSLNKSGNFNLDLGFRLLDGIFKGFDLKMEPLKAVLKGEREIALTFENVRRKNITHIELGSALMGQRVNMEHPSIGMLKNKKMGIYIVSSLLQSNQFTIQLGKTKNGSFDIEVPSIEAIADAGLKVGGDGKTELSCTHSGKNYLTFAFSCFELKLEDDGKVSIEQEVTWAKGLNIEDKKVAAENPEISFMNPKLPAIMSWDEIPEMII